MTLPSAKDVTKLVDHLPEALSAYNVCLELEKNATTEQDRIHARLLGYLILNAPSSIAMAEIVKVIHSCAQDHKTLSELGESFLFWFVRPFKKFKGRTATPSYHPSRPSFDKVKEGLKAVIKEAPKDHMEAKTQALVRDGYKCVVTGKYDVIAAKESLVDRELLAASGVLHTGLAHILPESTYFKVSNTSTSSPAKKDYAASVLAVLQRFGYDVEKVNGPKAHSLYNVMTLQHDVHDSFDRLELWFESTGVENRYRVQTTNPFFQVPSQVTFTSTDPSVLPYPSPQLLALHAACAKVAHLSGAREYIDKFDCDADSLDVLAADGSSSAILTHALLTSISRPISASALEHETAVSKYELQ